ncbi:RICIN domain-containing protein [Streptomyces sp. NPDC006339]|uniref:RICIN domain-containing protein n=1 Tax=Streptomyces sp. NPDC006339 TaxID=3156755 RepID=UPI0033B78E29
MATDRRDDEDPARALGRALRDLQRRSGCTLRSLETSVRISDSSLSRYFRGTTVPPWGTVRDLCEALGGDPAAYRSLWEAADRGQRRAVVQAPPPDDGPPPEARGSRGERGQHEEPGERGEQRWRGEQRERGGLGRTVWGLTGVVLGVALGATGAVLLRPDAPAYPSTAGEHAPVAARGATAGRPDAPRIFVSRATGACLDDSLDQGTRSYACNGLPYQRWTVHTTADGSVQLRNHATGECLDHDPGGDLRTVACGPSSSQRWTVSARDEAAVEIRNATTGRCLDDGAEGLRPLPCDRTKGQQWA